MQSGVERALLRRREGAQDAHSGALLGSVGWVEGAASPSVNRSPPMLAQALSLLACLVSNTFKVCAQAAIDVPLLIVGGGAPRAKGKDAVPRPSCTFYDGWVYHARQKPVTNSFRYGLRMCLVNLDKPPSWWTSSSEYSMTADDVRSALGADGDVMLLTIPGCCGYSQNPISVYYAYRGGALYRCIAEVTNTPWSERVVFSFDPFAKEPSPKALHVSPFMDMANVWEIACSDPGDTLSVSIQVRHPELGSYFFASFSGERSPYRERAERCSLGMLLRFGYMPHRVALWIYYQAVVLLWKGVPVHDIPERNVYASMVRERGAHANAAAADDRGRRLFLYDFRYVTWPWGQAKA